MGSWGWCFGMSLMRNLLRQSQTRSSLLMVVVPRRRQCDGNDDAVCCGAWVCSQKQSKPLREGQQEKHCLPMSASPPKADTPNVKSGVRFVLRVATWLRPPGGTWNGRKNRITMNTLRSSSESLGRGLRRLSIPRPHIGFHSIAMNTDPNGSHLKIDAVAPSAVRSLWGGKWRYQPRPDKPQGE